MDETVGTMGLPIAAILVAVTFKWFMKYDVLKGMKGTAGVWLSSLEILIIRSLFIIAVCNALILMGRID